MAFELDQHVHLNSWVHRWEPKHKFIGLMALMFAFALVKDWHLLPAMLVVTLSLYTMAKLPLPFLWQRLRYPGCFILGVVILLPFLSGETVIWHWGPMTLRQEGCLAMLLIVGRFVSIFTLSLILLSTSSFLSTIKAMRSLGLSTILTDMMLLSYRYIYELADTLVTMQRAMQLRGFRIRPHSKFSLIPDFRDLNLLASLAGTLLVRSYKQSERIYEAMRLRGYGNTQPVGGNPALPLEQKPFQVWDVAALILMLLVSAGFVVSDML
ncbi:MAG: cobalt ECF transporter T component CbiQ [Cyanothece sp. SIO1E1]|nr:cobalt ECF transporter T component CbiQ [Cyanothece sp. SIO1E1]